MWKAMDNPVVKSTIETLISMHDEWTMSLLSMFWLTPASPFRIKMQSGN
jgi:hypothetical protein